MLEVNDYVRINMDNRNCIGIGRVSRIVNETIYVNMNNKYNLPVPFQIDKVVKRSKQLIDLIEVGDIVNSCIVVGFGYECVNGNKEKSILVEGKYTKVNFALLNWDIKIILTKEQMMANCYKVGGKQWD
jgi:hypothetical protein